MCVCVCVSVCAVKGSSREGTLVKTLKWTPAESRHEYKYIIIKNLIIIKLIV
jgi:hypothetical protein